MCCYSLIPDIECIKFGSQTEECLDKAKEMGLDFRKFKKTMLNAEKRGRLIMQYLGPNKVNKKPGGGNYNVSLELLNKTLYFLV